MQTMTGTQRLLVTRRDPHTSGYEAVGELTQSDGGYSFAYRPGVTRPLHGMPDLSKTYRSDDLFPQFKQRVISPRRADHDQHLQELNLAAEASPFEVLARSGGRSAVDTYELTPVPAVGPVDILFLAHGIRHLTRQEQDAVSRLSPGDLICLQPEPENAHDSQAIIVSRSGMRLGYVPAPLAPYIHQVLQQEHRLVVERLNPLEAGFHMRLLLRLTGTYSP